MSTGLSSPEETDSKKYRVGLILCVVDPEQLAEIHRYISTGVSVSRPNTIKRGSPEEWTFAAQLILCGNLNLKAVELRWGKVALSKSREEPRGKARIHNAPPSSVGLCSEAHLKDQELGVRLPTTGVTTPTFPLFAPLTGGF